MVLSGYKNWIVTKLNDICMYVPTYIETTIQLCTVLAWGFQDQPVFVHYTGMHYFKIIWGTKSCFA